MSTYLEERIQWYEENYGNGNAYDANSCSIAVFGG